MGRRQVQSLSERDAQKRLVECRRLKKRLKRQKLALSNTQNDRVFADVSSKREVAPERLLKGRKHFSKSVMVSVAVSKLGKSSVVFVQPGAKVNSTYYCENFLEAGLLPEIRRISNNDFVFQQDGAPAHCSRHTVAYLASHVMYQNTWDARKLATEQSRS